MPLSWGGGLFKIGENARKTKRHLWYYISQLQGAIFKMTLYIIVPLLLAFTTALVSWKSTNNWRIRCYSCGGTLFFTVLIWWSIAHPKKLSADLLRKYLFNLIILRVWRWASNIEITIKFVVVVPFTHLCRWFIYIICVLNLYPWQWTIA